MYIRGWAWVCVYTATLFTEVEKKLIYQLADEELKQSCGEQWLNSIAVDKLTEHPLSFRTESNRSPVPRKTASKPFPGLLQAPPWKPLFQEWQPRFFRNDSAVAGDIGSKPSAHCSGFQRWTPTYLECSLPFCLFIFPELSAPSHGGLKIKSLPDLSMPWPETPMKSALLGISFILWHLHIAIGRMTHFYL